MDTESDIIDEAARAEIIQRLSEKLKAHYVFPEVAEQIGAHLQQHLAHGDYAYVPEGRGFAAALTSHIREVNHDQQVHHRATVVGEKTRGGANPGSPYRLHPHFEVFIPSGRAINPVTGTNWEGSGVTPDVAVPEDEAFTEAYRMALETILVGLGESPSGAQKDLAEETRTALEGVERQ